MKRNKFRILQTSCPHYFFRGPVVKNLWKGGESVKIFSICQFNEEWTQQCTLKNGFSNTFLTHLLRSHVRKPYFYYHDHEKQLDMLWCLVFVLRMLSTSSACFIMRTPGRAGIQMKNISSLKVPPRCLSSRFSNRGKKVIRTTLRTRRFMCHDS